MTTIQHSTSMSSIMSGMETPLTNKRRSAARVKPKPFSIGNKFPEWNETSIASEKWPHKQYEDNEFSLPPHLKENCNEWKRAGDVFGKDKLVIVSKREEEGNSPLINRHSFCFPSSGTLEGFNWMKAVVSSFLLIAENQDRFPEENFLWNLLWPKAKDSAKPVVNPYGKYVVKLFFYGTWRRVLVDDQVPLDKDGNCLLIHSANNHELWSLLLTKALIKVTDQFPKSQSNDSLLPHFLCGWTPQVLLNPKDASWDQLKANLKNEHTFCVAAVVLGKFVNDQAPVSETKTENSEEAQTQEAPPVDASIETGYVYRIVDVYEIGEVKLMKFRNHSTKPKYANNSNDVWTPELERDTGYTQEERAKDDYFFLTYEEFIEVFLQTRVYHNIDKYHFSESISALRDQSAYSIELPYLYTQAERETKILVCLSNVTDSETSPEQEIITSLNIEKYEWNQVNTMAPAKIRTDLSNVASAFISIPAGKNVYRLSADCTVGYHIMFCSQDAIVLDEYSKVLDCMNLSLIETEGLYKTIEANIWTILLKITINIVMPVTLSIQFLAEETLVGCGRLKIINNDTNEEEDAFGFKNIPKLYNPNELGYSLIVDCKSSKKIPQGRWKLRIIGDKPARGVNPIDTQPAFEVVQEVLKNVQEFQGTYTNNKYRQLFRKTVKVSEKSSTAIQLNCDGFITLEVIDNGEKIRSIFGKNCCTLSSLLLSPSNKKDKGNLVIQGLIGRTPPKEEKVSWKLRFVSSTILNIKNDTEREDQQAMIRASWEAGQPGRALKAKKSREKYLKNTQEAGACQLMKKVTKEQIKQLEEERKKSIELFNIVKQKMEKQREEDRLKSEEYKNSIRNELENVRREFANMQSLEAKRREQYNMANFEQEVHHQEEVVDQHHQRAKTESKSGRKSAAKT